MKLYIWKRVKAASGRLVWALALAAAGCAPRALDSRSYMESTTAHYATLTAQEIEEIECGDTDDLTDAEINYFKFTNGCK
jgi:hypothetical protein